MNMDIILQRIDSRLSSIENQLGENQKWRIIVQHYILKMFDFDIEKQLTKDNFLAFFYEPPTVANMVAKNLQLSPGLEPLLRKQQIELTQYLKNGISNRSSSSATMSNQNKELHHKIPNRHTMPPQQLQAHSQLSPHNIGSYPVQNTIHHHPQRENHIQTQITGYPLNEQLQNKPPPMPPLQRNPLPVNVNNLSPQQQQQQASMLQREMLWLKQIANRPTAVDTHIGPPPPAGPHHQHHHHNNNYSHQQINPQKASSNHLSQNRLQSSSSHLIPGTHRIPFTEERPIRLSRLPHQTTIEKVPGPELLEPLPKSRRLGHNIQIQDPSATSLATHATPAYGYSRGLQSQPNSESLASPYSKFQDMIDDLTVGRLGAVAAASSDSNSPSALASSWGKQTCRKSTSKPVTAIKDYSCVACGMRFRHKSAAQLHVSQVHSNISSSSSNDNTNEEFPQQNLLITSVESGGKRYIRKEGVKTFTSGLAASLNNNITSIRNLNSTTITPIIDEITISDDDDDDNNEDGDDKISGSRSKSIGGVQPNSEDPWSTTSNDEQEQTSSNSQRQKNIVSITQIQGSPENSNSCSSSSYVLSSSKISSVVQGVESPAESGGSGSERRRSRPNSNFSASTPQHEHDQEHEHGNVETSENVESTENMTIVPEINFYTHDNENEEEQEQEHEHEIEDQPVVTSNMEEGDNEQNENLEGEGIFPDTGTIIS